MENNNDLSSNWSSGGNTTGMGKALDGASLSQTLGIVGLCISVILGCLGCGLVGFILSIVAFFKGKSAVATYEANPSEYTEQSYKQAKTGKLLGLIGLILGIVVIIMSIFLFATGMLAEMMKK